MDSSAINLTSHGRHRGPGRYSDSFKASIVSACTAPCVSTAAVALANSLNADLVRRWVAESDPAHKAAVHLARAQASVPASPALTTSASTAGFVSVPLATPNADIRIELRRGDHLVTLYWPVAAGAQCLGALQDWLR